MKHKEEEEKGIESINFPSFSSFVSVEILRIPPPLPSPPPRRLNTDHCNLPDDRTTKKQKKTTRWGGRE